jgi:CHAT domain-containing protein/tetratricopeptide (TPR) repeat protein
MTPTSDKFAALQRVMEEAGSYEASMMTFALTFLPASSSSARPRRRRRNGPLSAAAATLSNSDRFAVVCASVLSGLKTAQCHSTVLSIARELVPADPATVESEDILAIALIANHAAWAAKEVNRPDLVLGYGKAQVTLGLRYPSESLILAQGYLWRALGYEQAGRLVEAAADYEAGLALAARLKGRPGAADVETMLRMNYDDLRHTRGEVGPATIVSRDSETGDSDLSMANRNLRALRLIAEGGLTEGLKLLEEVQADALRHGNHRFAGVVASNAGTALADAGDFKAAIAHFESARTYLSAPGCGELLGVAGTSLGSAYRALGRPDLAIEPLQEAWATFRREAPRSPKALYTLRELGMLRLAEGDRQRARSILDRALQLYESLRTDIGLTEEEHEGTMRSYRAVIEMHCYLSLTEGWVDEVESLIERGKARFWAEATAGFSSARCETEALPFSGDEVRRFRLPDPVTRRLVLNYFVGPTSTILLIRRGPTPEAKRLPVNEQELRELIDGLSFELQATLSRKSQDSVNQIARRIADLLFPGIDFSRTRSMLICPDGPLWALPFDVVVAAAAQTQIELQVPISLTPALHVLRSIEERRRPALPVDKWRVLAVGSPAAGASVEPIPGTRAQVEWIRTAFPSAEIFAADDATSDRLSGRITDATHIHIAAHAVADPDDDKPYVVLADGRGGPAPWYASDIARLSLRAELVFLSACTTAVGRQSTGEGFMSLGRAFLHAGADCVVSTLWQISDEWSLPLVRLFYKYLIAGSSVAVAVRRAQNEMRCAGAPTRMWSALQVVGDGYAAEDDLDNLP